MTTKQCQSSATQIQDLSLKKKNICDEHPYVVKTLSSFNRKNAIAPPISSNTSTTATKMIAYRGKLLRKVEVDHDDDEVEAASLVHVIVLY